MKMVVQSLPHHQHDCIIGHCVEPPEPSQKIRNIWDTSQPDHYHHTVDPGFGRIMLADANLRGGQGGNGFGKEVVTTSRGLNCQAEQAVSQRESETCRSGNSAVKGSSPSFLLFPHV